MLTVVPTLQGANRSNGAIGRFSKSPGTTVLYPVIYPLIYVVLSGECVPSMGVPLE